MNQKILDKFKNLTKAFEKFSEIVSAEVEDEIIKRDACIQRFEFTIELFWKFLKLYMIENGEKEINFPREVLQKAYKYNLINNEEIWLNMLTDKNRTSNIYDEEEIEKIYSNIRNNYYNEMKACYNLLKERVKSD
ncbi:MAG TPA: HI0074 family nucleotidyltransferase substrate-binding subunit [Rickettsiales bacterium]|nr:HI0074 family nucleotidyltransferase substrate-binding subunit [Rickettsiales bacterium]